jgi:hypothetical protein
VEGPLLVTPFRWLVLGTLGPDGERRWNRKGGASGPGKYPVYALGSGGGWSWGTNGARAHLILGEREHPEPDGVLRHVTAEQIAKASGGALAFARSTVLAIGYDSRVLPESLTIRRGVEGSKMAPDLWTLLTNVSYPQDLEEACAVPEGVELRSLIQIERAKSSEKGEDIRERLTRPKFFRLDKYCYNPFYLRDALRGLLHQMKGEKPRVLWARFPKTEEEPLALLSGASIESADRMALVRQIKE